MSRSTTTPAAPVITDDTATDANVNPNNGNVDNPDTVSRTVVTDADYAYDPATVVAAYQTGAIRLDVAKRRAHAAMADAIRSGDLASAALHVDAVSALDAASKTATSGARVITVADYATATLSRVVAMRDTAYQLAVGQLIPADVPSESHDDYIAAIGSMVGNDYGQWFASLGDDIRNAATSEFDHARASATRRVIGNADVDRHYAAIASGDATDRHGASFTVDPSTVYPFAVIAGLRTAEYPAGNLSHGAASAAFTRRDADRYPAGWVYATMPAGSRATHGARFVGTSDNPVSG